MTEHSSQSTGRRRAVVTGAGSGIGAATARALASEGFEVVCADRRADRIETLAKEIDGIALACDVTDRNSAAALAERVGIPVHVLVNDAGAVFGLEPVAETDPQSWRRAYDVNVIGTLHLTQAFLPALEASGDGLLVNVGSTAGRTGYHGGAGDTAAKDAVSVLTETLRLELLGRPIRVTEIAPGMVSTEDSSLTRSGGDGDSAEKVYAGVEGPLVAEDVGDCIAWVATRPSRVNVDLLVVKPRAQASQRKVHRVQEEGRRG